MVRFQRIQYLLTINAQSPASVDKSGKLGENVLNSAFLSKFVALPRSFRFDVTRSRTRTISRWSELNRNLRQSTEFGLPLGLSETTFSEGEGLSRTVMSNLVALNSFARWTESPLDTERHLEGLNPAEQT